VNKRTLKNAIETLETINERILSAYDELKMGGGDSISVRLMIWDSSPQQMFETIEAALEILDQAATYSEMLRNFLEEESCEGVDIDSNFDDNEPNICDKCSRRMNRKGQRQ